MANLMTDSGVERVAPGRYRATLSENWAVWGPNGGYIAAVALRAALAESRLPRPASFQCHFLSVGAFEPVSLEVESLGGGKRAESLRVDLIQGERRLLAATLWTTSDDLLGYEHDFARAPELAPAAELESYAQLAGAEYEQWYPIWRSIEGRPLAWGPQPPGDPVWRCWLRLNDTPVRDVEADAVRQLFWLDLPGWNATISAHPWPFPYLTPNLDLTVQFHRFDPSIDWMLVEGSVPTATDGLLGCVSRLWSADGRLLATGTSKHSCRRNPDFEQQREEQGRAQREGPPRTDV